MQISCFFQLFSTKNAENDFFNQRLECAAPKRWSKYTTLIFLIGIPGVLLYPIFAPETGILWAGNTAEAWSQLGVNLAGLLAILLWTSFWSIAIFYPLRYFGKLRVDVQTEYLGCDSVKHGELAYPAAAWIEIQYSK